jgi:hypothetical protein
MLESAILALLIIGAFVLMITGIRGLRSFIGLLLLPFRVLFKFLVVCIVIFIIVLFFLENMGHSPLHRVPIPRSSAPEKPRPSQTQSRTPNRAPLACTFEMGTNREGHKVGIHTVIVDLSTPGLRIRPVLKNDYPGADAGETVSSMAKRVSAAAAVNCDYFAMTQFQGPGRPEPDWHKPQGPIKVDGKLVGERIIIARTVLAFDEKNRAVITRWEGDRPEFRQVVGGGPIILKEGRYSWNPNNDDDIPSNYKRGCYPHTSAGTTSDGGKLILAVVQGVEGHWRTGFDSEETARLLAGKGAQTGMLFDGGGSSTLYIDGRVVNHPTDGSERPVADALCIIIPGR